MPRWSKFDKLSNKVTKEYEDKGYSKEKAEEIGEGTAANVAREKGKAPGKK